MSEPTAIDALKAALPRLADQPEYAAALDEWRRAAADRDAANAAARSARTDAGRAALLAVADRAVAGEKDSAARLEAARQAAAASVQDRTLLLLKGVRTLRLLMGLTERGLALLYWRLCEEIAAAGLVPDPADGTAALNEVGLMGEREAAEADHVAFARALAGDWCFDTPAGAAQAVDEVTAAVNARARDIAAAAGQIG